MADAPPDTLDCLIVGGGPAGLTAALYLARFNRRFLVVDDADSRAAWIPTSHNIPGFAEGISGPDMLARLRAHLARYDAPILDGEVMAISKDDEGFLAQVQPRGGSPREMRFRRVLLATGAADVEPDLPDLPNAVQRGLIRYCPICDGYEAAGKTIGVVGFGDRGLGEAVFVARTYSRDVTLMTLGQTMELDAKERKRIDEHGVKVVYDPVVAIEMDGDRIAAVHTGTGVEHRFEVLYSALGLKPRSDLGERLGARRDETGALLVDEHNRTSVGGLYAAGGVVRGLDQIVVAMGHAAIAATDIHNRCELPTEDEPGGGV